MIIHRAITILFIIAVMPCTLLTAATHFPADSTYFTTKRFGPFALLNDLGDTVRVFVEVGHVHLNEAEYGHDWNDTDYSHSFLDEKGKVLIRSVNRCDYTDGATILSAVQLIVPRVGPLVLLMSQTAPSAPPTCTDGTLYGLDRFGHLVPFTARMVACGGMEAETFRPVLIKSDGGRAITGEYSVDEYGEPAIEIEECHSNFSIYRFSPIWWSGSSPAVYYQARYRIRVDSLYAKESRARYRTYNADTLVSILSEAKKGDTSATIVPVAPNSVIRFLYAVEKEGLWLRIVVDAHEGYVGEKDFEKLGLSDW